MPEISGEIAWIVSGAIVLWLLVDFVRVNLSYGEDVLTSSREGVDELFPEQPASDDHADK